ncbi:replication protein Rep [Mycolicibacterium conceptionense]|uniref:Replication protein Rep n=1 Tax=Mycolicibacterium conceptionense TaxID=451644 RepID=A0A0U1DYW1_9MYCO|nr:replication protein Rep [Mycolicibacterium conceptionense]
MWLDGELVYLELPEDVHKGVPCWTGKAARWVHFTVAIAYDLHYDEIRPQMVNGGISKPALLVIAAARARYADHDTGRNCRPTNDQLAAATGFSVRQVTELTPPNGPDGGGEGRAAAREAAMEAARNAARKRTEEAARQAAQLDEAVQRARGLQT